MRLSIVIPAHNEEKRIGPMLEAYLPFFSGRYGENVEFLVVVNGSTDKTEEVARGYAARFPCMKVVVEPARIGKGGALMVGFRQAGGELVGFVDADGSTPPQAFQDLVDNIGEAGGIIASRWSPGAVISPRQPLDRRIASRMFNLLTRTLFGLRLTDTQCGAKLMRREAVEVILPHLGITQWAFDVDLLFQLRRAGYKIKEIPTTWHDVAGSKIQVGQASIEMMLALIRLRVLYSPFNWMAGLYSRFIAPWLHPVGVVRDHLITHSLMLFAGGQLANICNMAFQIAMVRMLGNAEYGVMSAMMGLLAMIGAPLGSLSGTVTHFTSHAMLKGDFKQVRGMMGSMGRDLLWPSVALLLVMVLWHQDFASALKLESSGPLYLAAGALVVMLLSSIPSGALVGLQEFKWAALTGVSWPVTRLVLGVVLALMGFGAMGALTAHLAGCVAFGLLTLVICVSLLGKVNDSEKKRIFTEAREDRKEGDSCACSVDGLGLNSINDHAGAASSPQLPSRSWWASVQTLFRGGRESTAGRPKGIYSYMGGYMAAFGAYGVLSSADVLLVKYYFSPEQAGIFAKAAMVARIVFYLPGPIAAAMFPKVTSGGDSSRDSRRILFKAIMISSVVVGAGCLLCVALPGLMLGMLAGGAQPGQEAVLRGMALALTPLTVVMLILNYELAQRRFGIMIPLYFCAAGYLLGVWRWHGTPLQVVGVLAGASWVALLCCMIYQRTYRPKLSVAA